MAAIQSQAKNPLAERKSNVASTSVVSHDKPAAKLNLPEHRVNTYAPKSTTALSLKTYLKRNLNHTIALGEVDAKSRPVNRSHQTNESAAMNSTSGAVTQRGHSTLKESFHGEAPKTTRAGRTSGSPAPVGWRSSAVAPANGEVRPAEKRPPHKNLSINATDVTQGADTTQLKCLTARNAIMEPLDANANAPLQPSFSISIPNQEPAKCSLKSNGVVKAYAANTNQGLVRYTCPQFS
ncbi:MAG: hypothetical protein P4L10_16695 [Acidobacteriaceae bacterium]|nr:hypothetical protein [Acidobacteriaceae bacterium]